MFMFVTTLVFIFIIRLRFPSKVSIATNSINLLSRLYAILFSITKKTARKWKFGIVDNIVLRPQVPACFGFTIVIQSL